MKRLLFCLVMLGCSAAPEVAPNAVTVTINSGEAYECYVKAHGLDAGKEDRMKAFDDCACEAGHCQ